MNQYTMMFADYPTLSPLPVRVTSHATNSFDVIDGEKVLLKICNPVNLSEYFAAIYVWQKKFAAELHRKFHQMLDEAEENAFWKKPGS